MNDALAISLAFGGVITTRTTFDDPDLPEIPAAELFSLSFGLGAQVREGVYITTDVGVALTGDDSVTASISTSYTFDAHAPSAPSH